MYDEKQVALLHAAIRAVARDGLEKTTTRSIGAAAKINDAYIYRYFKDKEDLLSQAYMMVNEQLVTLVIKAIREVKDNPVTDTNWRFSRVVRRLWEELTDNPDVCSFCNYYYHSASYKKYTHRQHRELVDRTLTTLGEDYTLRPEAAAAIYYLMESIIGFVSKVNDGQYADSPEIYEIVVARLYPIFQSVASPKGQGRVNSEK